MRRTVALILSIVLFIGIATGCGNSEGQFSAEFSSVDSSENITINGVSISQYAIIYPEENIIAKYAAEMLSEFFNSIGKNIRYSKDTIKENDFEILLGNTNRMNEGRPKLKSGEFLLSAKNKKIIMTANDYTVAGAVSEFINNNCAGIAKGDTKDIIISKDATPKKFEFIKPKNAILMIGDGMGENHIKAALHEGLNEFVAEQMPNKGKTSTYSYTVLPLLLATATDSAAVATALATGYKTENGFIGVSPDTKKTLKNVRELAYEKGAKTAILTTDVITGATPAGFLAHLADRKDNNTLKSQINKLINEGGVTVAKGSLGSNLLEIEKNTLAQISKDGSNFFMMLEEGYIDKHSHNNNYLEMINTIKRFNDTVAYAMVFCMMHPDTVLIVTANHECGDLQENESNKFVYRSKNHTGKDVPVYAMGYGTEIFKDTVNENTNIAKFIAAVFGDKNFGDTNIR